jgi:hypothetical protein
MVRIVPQANPARTGDMRSALLRVDAVQPAGASGRTDEAQIRLAA